MAGLSIIQRFFGPHMSSFTSFGFFAVLSIICITGDHKVQFMGSMRYHMAELSVAAYHLATFPFVKAEEMLESFHSKVSLQAENKKLKEEIQKIRLDSWRIDTLSAENQELRKMLQAKENLEVSSRLFDVQRVISEGFTQNFIINGGAEDGIKVGMPVISGSGLAGQINRVSKNTSIVQLIQDKNQVVPVFFKEAKVFGVVQGIGDGCTLESRDLPFSEEIREGDTVVTSGLDGIYPRGIPVGVVMSSKPSRNNTYSLVSVASPQSIHKSNQVLVLLVDMEKALYLDEQEDTNSQRRRALRK